MTNLFVEAAFTGIAPCQECALATRVGQGRTAPSANLVRTAFMEHALTGRSSANVTAVSKENLVIFPSVKLTVIKQEDIAQLPRLACAKTAGAARTVHSAFPTGSASTAIASIPGSATVSTDFLDQPVVTRKIETAIGGSGARGHHALELAPEAASGRGRDLATTPRRPATELIAR